MTVGTGRRAWRLFDLFVLPLLLAGVGLVTRGAARADDDQASAAEAREFLAALAKRSDAMRTLTVRFRQEKKLKILRRPRRAEGDLVYSGGRLAVTLRRTGGEVESRLLWKDGALKVLYPSLKRLEVLELEPGSGPPRRGSSASALAFFTGDWRRLEEEYRVSLTTTRPGSKDGVLTLLPKSEDSGIREIRMTFADLQVREYVQVASSGDSVRMEVLSWKVNEKIQPQRFELAVPPGTKTVRLNPESR